MDIYLLYAYVGVVCAVVIGIILNRVKTTEYKDTIDRRFCGALWFFIAFCCVDAAWGIIGSPFWFVNRTAYVISTYGFHFMAALASFICSAYVLHQLNLPVVAKRLFDVLRYLLITAQMVLILQNVFTGLFFTIDADAVYHSGVFRSLSFLLQFCHYVPIIIYALVGLLGRRDKETAYTYRSSLIFSLLPLIFGILQMLYPDGPFYSLGFLITAVTMYAFNVTRQREVYLAAYMAAEERERSQKEIEEALARAEAANAAKTVFLANMSHDIRTPINGIMGMVTLAKKEEMPEPVNTYVRKIDVASRHLLSLINDVLDMSRIESGKATIQCDPTDVRMIVDNCTSIIQGQMEGRELHFVPICGEMTHTRILADVLHLRRVLINILGNAIKFTPDGGTVTFTARETGFDGKTATFEFVVEDTGIGMSEEFLAHIFESFSQEHNSSRGRYQGTGLGMAISQQLVTLMGGTIDVASTLGQGSRFTVRIPFEVVSVSAEESPTPAAADTSLSGYRILLVEDNELNMEIAKTILEQEGVQVTAAENGREAVERFCACPPGSFDAILMDIMMPEMNGYEATEAIRRSGRPEGETVPIIAMTANAFAEDKIKAMEAGMNAHVAKPIHFPTLAAEITRLCRQGINGKS